MNRRSFTLSRLSALLVLLLVFAYPSFAHAGGWAVVTLDHELTDIRAGQPFTVGFVVRQHGTHLTEGLAPVITAVNADGDVVTAQARPEGGEGHYVAELTLPAGTWTWQIDAFHPIAHMGTLEVPASAPAATGISLPRTMPFWWLWVLGVALIIAGGVQQRQRRGALA